MNLINKFELFNKYKANGWDTEHTYKFIYESNRNQLIEVGFFIHLKDGKEYKKVIEMPTSYGCPMKCKFCASATIDDFSLIDTDDLMKILDKLYKDYDLYNDENLSISLTGTGEMLYTIDVIGKFIKESSTKYKNLKYVVSSIAINKNLINKLEKISKYADFRFIQLSYICEECSQLVPNIKNTNSLNNIIKVIKDSSFTNFRINYIMINGVNDEEEKYTNFLNVIKEVKEKVIIRISTINQTNSSINNGICGVEIEKMEKLKENLNELGIKAYIFKSEKNDNMNCGQLISEINK